MLARCGVGLTIQLYTAWMSLLKYELLAIEAVELMVVHRIWKSEEHC